MILQLCKLFSTLFVSFAFTIMVNINANKLMLRVHTGQPHADVVSPVFTPFVDLLRIGVVGAVSGEAGRGRMFLFVRKG